MSMFCHTLSIILSVQRELQLHPITWSAIVERKIAIF
jgi:hypothetical protein